MSRPTQAIIDLVSLNNNLEQLKALTNNSKTIAVVKANAYGNGAIEVAKSIQYKVDILAVAFLAEAIELRQAGITKTILILQGPHQEQDLYTQEYNDFIWLMHSHWQLLAFQKYFNDAGGNSTQFSSRVWLKFDTGMHRLGFSINTLNELFNEFSSILNENTVLATHLANADEADQARAQQQISTFLDKVANSKQPLCIANSASAVRFDAARKNYVRLGIAIYGSTPFEANDSPIELAPVMRLESEIISLRNISEGECVGYGSTFKATRKSVIATVALGYADGYPRHAPSGTPAWCNSQIVPLVGRVSMDMICFDVSDVNDVSIGDKVQLWGDKLAINEVADYVGTIAYELMTRVSQRVPRTYLQNE